MEGRRRWRRRKEESRVNRGQVAPPDASRATALLRPLASSHPNDPATLPPFSLPHSPPVSSSASSSLTSHATLSKPPPRFYLRFLLAARAARGGWFVEWVVNHPRATFGSHARTTVARVRRHLRWCAVCKDGFTTAVRRINSAERFDGVSAPFFCSMRFSSTYPRYNVYILLSTNNFAISSRKIREF